MSCGLQTRRIELLKTPMLNHPRHMTRKNQCVLVGEEDDVRLRKAFICSGCDSPVFAVDLHNGRQHELTISMSL